MLQVRPSEERGHNRLSWLDSRLSFSFDEYYDPEHMQFRSLRVLNEDVVSPSQGFGMHPHRDMEILTWVLDGELRHRDSTGGEDVIRPGELQHMSAGTGVMHSEFNPSSKNPAHFLQIWLTPESPGLKPMYEQLAFPDKDLRGKLYHVAGPEAPVTIRQDANLFVGRFNAGESATQPIAPGRHAWVQVARGAVRVNGVDLKQGDGAALSKEAEVRLEAAEPAEVLVFDLA